MDGCYWVTEGGGRCVGAASGGARWWWKGLELRVELLPYSVSTAMRVLVRGQRVVSYFV